MSLGGQTVSSQFLPPARHLHRDSHVVQEHIRKTQLKQDAQKTVKANLQHKHAQRRQKVLVVANRLPTSVSKNEAGDWTFNRCSGGLVSCLAGLQRGFDMVWIGWPGADVPEEDKDMVCAEAMKQGCYPVFLSQELISEYYNGFANNVLWPLFHYIMPPFDKGVNECSTGQWAAYQQANQRFVDAILEVYEDDDYVWVHDYHLMLVPKMLRDVKPDSSIGWFLHTPFPSAEIYRTLPWRQEIIESLLHSNLLGFHVYDYLRHFLSSCVQLTSLEISAHSVDATSIGGCLVTCATVPIGISPEEFSDALQAPEVKQQVEKLRDLTGDRKVILGIDRLDYMKGIPHKLRAFGVFLDAHPDYAEKCVLVQVAVPSRRDVPEYQRLQRQVHELVGQICGRHSTLETGVPVIYRDASMSFHDLVALYHVADIALITSLRDGMNLVSYEFVACHKDRNPPGVLILSEFAGAAQSLGAGAIRVNPWNLQDTAQAIYDALEMTAEEKMSLHSYAYKYVTEHTSQKWAETFLQCLQEASSDLMEVSAEVPALLPYEQLLTEWSESERRLIIIDLLECLVAAKRRPGMKDSRRTKALSIPPDLRESLMTIANSPNTTVVITTDKSRKTLAHVAGNLPVILAPEGCSVYRRKGENTWTRVVEESDLAGLEDWMGGVEVVFDYFQKRTPGSQTEKQGCQYRWYWDNAQLDFGHAQAREVLINLWAGPLVNSEAEVVVGDRSITVRPHACSRWQCLERLLQWELGEEELHKVDFALCFAAVSHRDEDVFENLQGLLAEDQNPQEADFPYHVGSPIPEGVLILNSPRSDAMTGADENEHPALHTPLGPAPPVKLGEDPPEYDWIPTAQREQVNNGCLEEGYSSPVMPNVQLPPAASCTSSDDRHQCIFYTLSLGVKKTKAQHALPHPYHVQNLIRAMAARLPQKHD